MCVYVCVCVCIRYISLLDFLNMTLLPWEEQNLRHKGSTCENFSSEVLKQKTKGSYIGGFPIILSGA